MPFRVQTRKTMTSSLPLVFLAGSFLLSAGLTATGVRALLRPVEFSDSFGLPVAASNPPSAPRTPASSTQNGSSQNQIKSSTHTTAQLQTHPSPSPWLIPLATRNVAIGVSSLSLLWLGNLQAASVVLLCVGIGTGIGDTVVCLEDEESTAKGRMHAIASSLLVLFGGLGLVLGL